MKDKFPTETRDAFLSGDVTPLIRATLRRMRLEFETTLYQFNTAAGVITYPEPPDEPTPAADSGFKVGTFTKNTATGTQAVTGLGFKPEVLFLWCTRQTSLGSSNSNVYNAMGMACRNGEGDTTYQSAIAWSAHHGQSGLFASDACLWTEDNYVLVGYQYDETALYSAQMSSWDSDGFTLNWATNEANASYVGYIAFASADLTDKFIKNWNTKGATGTQAQTGVGFQPDWLFNIATNLAGATSGNRTNPNVGFGWGNGVEANQRGTGIGIEDAFLAGGSGQCYHRLNEFIAIPDRNQVAGVLFREHIESLDADGFTTDCEDAPNANNFACHALALKGLANIATGSFTARITAGDDVVTGVGFQPDLVIFMGTGCAVLETPWNGGSSWSFGAMDGDGNQFCTTEISDYYNPSKCYRSIHNDICLGKQDEYPDADGTIDKTLEYKSMDSDGFTVTVTIPAATNLHVSWLAIKVTTE